MSKKRIAKKERSSGPSRDPEKERAAWLCYGVLFETVGYTRNAVGGQKARLTRTNPV